MKVGQQRKQEKGYFDMATDIEIIARRIGLTLHDKIYSQLEASTKVFFQKNCFENKYSMKLHECNLIFIDYE